MVHRLQLRVLPPAAAAVEGRQLPHGSGGEAPGRAAGAQESPCAQPCPRPSRHPAVCSRRGSPLRSCVLQWEEGAQDRDAMGDRGRGGDRHPSAGRGRGPASPQKDEGVMPGRPDICQSSPSHCPPAWPAMTFGNSKDARFLRKRTARSSDGVRRWPTARGPSAPRPEPETRVGELCDGATRLHCEDHASDPVSAPRGTAEGQRRGRRCILAGLMGGGWGGHATVYLPGEFNVVQAKI